MLSYSIHPGGGWAVVTPPEEIDLTNAEQLQDELDTALDRGITTLIVDMSRTTFCDSAGTSALARTLERASSMNADLRLVIASKSFIRRVFTINGFAEVVQIYPSLAAAHSGIPDNALDPSP